MAAASRSSAGRSKIPHSCAQAYSGPNRLTPTSRIGVPFWSTTWLPATPTNETRGAGAGTWGGAVVAGAVDVVAPVVVVRPAVDDLGDPPSEPHAARSSAPST